VLCQRERGKTRAGQTGKQEERLGKKIRHRWGKGKDYCLVIIEKKRRPEKARQSFPREKKEETKLKLSSNRQKHEGRTDSS